MFLQELETEMTPSQKHGLAEVLMCSTANNKSQSSDLEPEEIRKRTCEVNSVDKLTFQMPNSNPARYTKYISVTEDDNHWKRGTDAWEEAVIPDQGAGIRRGVGPRISHWEFMTDCKQEF
eukprot:Gb_01076 [translate_table: standard]